MVVYLRSDRFPEGAFLPESDAGIRPDDRGFLFGDGIYEVIRCYGSRMLLLDRHLARLCRNAAEVRLARPDPKELAAIGGRLVNENGLGRSDATVYIQLTRGAAPRRHAFPDPPVPPTLYVRAAAFDPATVTDENGISAVTVPDIRWTRCDIKTICLLPGVLARQRACEAGAAEALFVRDGRVTEGTHTNIFGARAGELLTHPAGPHILDGITRQLIIELAAGLDIPVRETPILEEELPALDELLLTGTTVEVAPVIKLNGRPVADGRPGPLTRRLQAAFRAAAASDRSPAT